MNDRWDDELPIKLGPCSNGEFVPPPLGAVEREAIRLTRELADATARRLAMDRRRFLQSLGGAALMLTTLAACHSDARRAKGQRPGGTFTIPPEATTEPEAASGALAGDEFILDVQTHFLEIDTSNRTAGCLRRRVPASALRRRRSVVVLFDRQLPRRVVLAQRHVDGGDLGGAHSR